MTTTAPRAPIARMGVEYRHMTFVRGRYRPSAARVARFARALAEEGWIASPKTFREKKVPASRLPQAASRSGALLRVPGQRPEPAPFAPTAEWLRSKKPYVELAWPMVDVLELGWRFPVQPLPYFRERLYYELEIHWSQHYLDVVSNEDRWPEFSGRCACGTDLALPREHLLAPTFYRTSCPECGQDPASFESGQLLHRFALVIDCGKNLPEDAGAPASLHPSLRALQSRMFSAKFTQVGVVC